MSKNQKSINIFKEFFQEKMGANTYDTSEYKLTENYPLSMMIHVESGGSTGGSCWGSHTAQYDKHDSDITNSIAGDIQYNLRGLAHSFNLDEEKIKILSFWWAERVLCNDVGSKSDGGDYYGNYTKYKMFAVDALSILKQVMIPKDYEILEGVASTIKLTKDREYKSADLLNKEQELVNKIGNFSEVKSDERDKTEKNLQNAKNLVEQLTQNLKNFDDKKNQDKSKLTTQLEKVRKERIAHEGTDVESCTVQKETKKNRYF